MEVSRRRQSLLDGRPREVSPALVERLEIPGRPESSSSAPSQRVSEAQSGPDERFTLVGKAGKPVNTRRGGPPPYTAPKENEEAKSAPSTPSGSGGTPTRSLPAASPPVTRHPPVVPPRVGPSSRVAVSSARSGATDLGLGPAGRLPRSRDPSSDGHESSSTALVPQMGPPPPPGGQTDTPSSSPVTTKPGKRSTIWLTPPTGATMSPKMARSTSADRHSGGHPTGRSRASDHF